MQAWQYSAVREARSSLQEQAEFYSNVWHALFSALFLAAGVMTALAKIEIRILADEAYFSAWQTVPVLCAAMLFCAFTSFLGSVYTVTRKSGISFWTSLLGAGVNVLLNALLFPSKLGILGAAIATFASYFIVFLVRAANARRPIPFRLFKAALFTDSAVLAVQILFLSFQWPGWKVIQGIAIAALLFLNQAPLRKLLKKGR